MKKYDIQVINLDRNTARWSNMDKQFRSQRIENVIRFSAIDGKMIESSPQFNLVHPKAIESAKRGYRLSHQEHNFGSIGCYLSHTGTWKNIVDSGNDFGIVFEDDVKIPSFFVNKFEQMIQDAPADWELIVFGPYELIDHVRNWKKQSKHKYIISRWFMLNSYVIKASCCEKLLKRAFPVLIQVDWWVAAQQGDCNMWILEKPIVGFARGFNSDINHTPVLHGGKLIEGRGPYERSSKLKRLSSMQQNSLTIIVVVIVIVVAVAVITATTVTLLGKKKNKS